MSEDTRIEDFDIFAELTKQLKMLDGLLGSVMPGDVLDVDHEVSDARALLASRASVLDKLAEVREKVVHQDRLLKMEQALMTAMEEALETLPTEDKAKVKTKFYTRLKQLLEMKG